ncbi:hypothetical protein MMO38_10080 [Acinetobacter sp. NIPH 1852]|uniref:hypothetical protein n=1 Tax=unclassified Acinetobacter TaxID=196816 RepID=UPI0002D0F669|nr:MULTISPECIES: hypothetical protein [unclassified Acinetobacter]ENW95841.1 hypothetical protein F903_01604 [Acinetobacter sp. NIPH 298]MCH7308479.1 hypothetical protein [Acinetobacter sp. NIPH 1852]
MLKTIITLGTGVALGCYYKSHKDKSRLSDDKKSDAHDLTDDVKGKKVLSKLMK